jgi:hypothetical protein
MMPVSYYRQATLHAMHHSRKPFLAPSSAFQHGKLRHEWATKKAMFKLKNRPKRNHQNEAHTKLSALFYFIILLVLYLRI